MKSKNLKIHSTSIIYHLFFVALVVFGNITSSAAQDVIDKIDAVQEFKSLDNDMNSALTNQVDVLSPRNFKVANSYLEDARKSLDKQNDFKKEMHRQITVARDYLNSANEAARRSRKHIGDVAITRQQAVVAGAPVYFPYDFKKADELLQKVTSDLEYNNTQNIEKNRSSLQASYSDLELRAIKHQNLAEARLTLVQAIKDGAKTYAPEKLKAAVKNYKDTLAYITEHRHDVDQIQARSLSSNESANQLIQTTHEIAEAKKNSSVESIASIAPGESKDYFEDLISSQQSSVSTEQKTIQSLEAKIEALEKEKAIDEKLERVRSRFTANEAEVYRQGSTLIISLRGLKFPTSQAVLNDSNLRLLAKVQRVVKEFGNREVVIEGHADSLGSAAINEKLSKKRAQTIKTFLQSIDPASASRIKVIGRGELAPIASDNTPEGRALNRRADILIKL